MRIFLDQKKRSALFQEVCMSLTRNDLVLIIIDYINNYYSYNCFIYNNCRALRGDPSLKSLKLALNCVCGRSAAELTRHLGEGAVMVTYGGMSRQVREKL